MSIDTTDPVYQLWLAFRGSVSRAECQAKVDQFALDGQTFPPEIEELLWKVGIDVRARSWTLLELVQALAVKLNRDGSKHPLEVMTDWIKTGRRVESVADAEASSKRELDSLYRTALDQIESLRTQCDRATDARDRATERHDHDLRVIEAVQRSHEDTRARLAEYVEKFRLIEARGLPPETWALLRSVGVSK